MTNVPDASKKNLYVISVRYCPERKNLEKLNVNEHNEKAWNRNHGGAPSYCSVRDFQNDKIRERTKCVIV